MGSYTTLSDFARAAWAGRRKPSPETQRTDTRGALAETRYLCARCEEGYAFDGPCPRCEQPTVDRLSVLPMGKPIDVGAALRKDATLVVGLMSATLAAFAMLYLVWGYPTSAGVYAAFGLIAVCCAAVGLPSLASRIRDALDRRATRRAARAARSSVAASLSAGDDEGLVRVRGKARFDVEGARVRVRVVDENGTALLPERGDFKAFDAATFAARDELLDGDEVEIVAHARKRAATGEAYRIHASVLEIDAAAPIHVWIRRCTRD